MIPKRATSQAVEERGTEEAVHARFFWSVLRWTVSIVALGASVPMLAGLLFDEYEGGWVAILVVFALASFALIAMTPKSKALLAIEGEATPRQHWSPLWPLVSYLAILGLELNWSCVFFSFSRRYALFSVPVISATALILVFYAAIALLAARLTGANWRTALLICAISQGVPAGIVLRLGLLW